MMTSSPCFPYLQYFYLESSWKHTCKHLNRKPFLRHNSNHCFKNRRAMRTVHIQSGTSVHQQFDKSKACAHADSLHAAQRVDILIMLPEGPGGVHLGQVQTSILVLRLRRSLAHGMERLCLSECTQTHKTDITRKLEGTQRFRHIHYKTRCHCQQACSNMLDMID